MLVTLIVLMAIVLSGLILVQTSMIKSASDIREEQFNKQVQNALIQVARQLEADEERFARLSVREGRIPGSPGVMNEFGAVFPRTKRGNLLNFKFSYTEGNIYGNFVSFPVL